MSGEVGKSTYKYVAIVLGAIGVIGLIFNLFVIVIIIVDSKHRWTPTNVVLLNLAMGDFLVAVFGNPFALISALNHNWYWGAATCRWYAWLMSTLGLASIGNLTVMAFERWILIANPTRPLSIRSAMYLVFCVWIYALVQSLPPLFGWGSYGLEGGNISCSVSWEIRDSKTHNESYIVFLFTLGFIMPIIVIFSSYLGIIIKLKRARKRVGSRSKREIKVTKMVAVMIAAFLFSWIPYAAFAIAVQYFHFQPSPSVALIPSVLAKSSICYNPVIYAFLSSQFVQALKKLLGIKQDRTKRQRRNLDDPSHTTRVSVM